MQSFKKIAVAALSISLLATSCKKDLAVENPNNPTPATLDTEKGILSFATGGVYITGFRALKYTDGVFGPFWSGATGFHDLMGDIIGADAANAFLNQLGCPEYVQHDDGTRVLNPNRPNNQIELIRNINVNSQAGNNFLYYEWAYMYNLIGTCNLLLEKVETATLTGDVASKKAAIRAWALWWKGFAYSRIGSTYYAGLILNSSFETNGNYVSKEKIMEEANATLDKAVVAAKSAPSAAEFVNTWKAIIPAFFQLGTGGAMNANELERNVNSLKARNLLVNKRTKDMTAADWNQVLSLANAGKLAADKNFTIRSDVRGDLYSTGQLMMGRTYSNSPGGATYKVSERWVQEFKTGDKRLEQNFKEGTKYVGQADRGNAHFTRWALINGGAGLPGVKVFASGTAGDFEMQAAVDFDENELMKAEALINTSRINEGLALIDGVRSRQGAALAAVANTGLTLDQAKEELRRERRIVTALRGLSFYDARRWGVIDQNGGRTKAVALKNDGTLSTNATIYYNYLDYWDVPGNELTYNEPAAGSAPVKNPR